LAESGEFVRAATREFPGGEDRASELAGQLFNACGTVDGRANAGEIEPVAAADIAVEDIADVQRESVRAQSMHDAAVPG